MPARRYRYSNSSDGCLSIIAVYFVIVVIGSVCSAGSSQASSSSSPATVSRRPNSSASQSSNSQSYTFGSQKPKMIAPQLSDSRAGNCDPAYPDTCLQDGIGDYDCAGGSVNGPNYARGPVRVLPPDPFSLDRDGDGIGCE